MARYAIVNNATNIVENVIEWNGDTNQWSAPSGTTAREATATAEIGGTWNGSAFVRAASPSPSRTDVLMHEVTTTQKWNADTAQLVNKTSDEIAAEKAELRTLLTNALTGGSDLTYDQTQTLLRLERE